jgi:hypothetical protein
MSWSVSAIGRAQAVKVRMSSELDDVCSRLAEPEKSVAMAAWALIAATCDAQVPDSAIRLTASGSQSSYGTGDGRKLTNNVKVEVEPILGFLG